MRKYLWVAMMAVLASGLVLFLAGRLPHRPIELSLNGVKSEEPTKVEVTQPVLVLPKPPKFMLDPFAPIELFQPPEPTSPSVVNEGIVPVQGRYSQPPRFYMPYADEVEEPTALQSLWTAITDIVEKVQSGKAAEQPGPDDEDQKAPAPCPAANPGQAPSIMPYADNQPLPWDSPLEGSMTLIRGWVRPLGVSASTVSRTRQLEPIATRMPYADEEDER